MRACLKLVVLALVGCTRGAAPSPPARLPAPDASTAEVVEVARAFDAGPPSARDRNVVEVEMSGKLDRTKVKAKDYLLYVSVEPCLPLPARVTSLGDLKPQADSSDFFIEIFPLAGSVGHVCAMALDDKGQVIGVAANPGNPLTFVGEGELEFFKIPLVLQKVKPQPKPEWKRPL